MADDGEDDLKTTAITEFINAVMGKNYTYGFQLRNAMRMRMPDSDVSPAKFLLNYIAIIRFPPASLPAQAAMIQTAAS